MSIGKSVTPTALLFCAGSLFVVLGVLANPLYFSAAFACLAAGAAMRGDALQRSVFGALALLFVLVVLGYGIGKDLAQRDNLRDAQAVASTDRQ